MNSMKTLNASFVLKDIQKIVTEIAFHVLMAVAVKLLMIAATVWILIMDLMNKTYVNFAQIIAIAQKLEFVTPASMVSA